MRDGWNRATAVLDLSTEVVEGLVCKAIPGAKVIRFQVVDGGLANTNIKVEHEHPGRSSVLLKIFVRDPETAPKEYALNQLVCQRVQTPRFLYFSGKNSSTERSPTMPSGCSEPAGNSVPTDSSVQSDSSVPSSNSAPSDSSVPSSNSVPSDSSVPSSNSAPSDSLSPPDLVLSSDPDIGFPCAVIEWVDGVMLQSVFPNLSDEQRRRLGESVGSALARIHSFKFPDFGFFDDDLKIKKPIAMDGAGLLSYVRQCLVDGPGGKRIGIELTERLIEFLEREAKLLDLWTGEPCLTHADFNHSNILIAPLAASAPATAISSTTANTSAISETQATSNTSTTGNTPTAVELHDYGVAAVLDWEFAFSGTPFFDLGNLLREPLGASKSFVGGVEYGYKQAGGVLPTEWRKMSLLADLTAWAEFMTREVVNDNLIADAVRVIEQTINS